MNVHRRWASHLLPEKARGIRLGTILVGFALMLACLAAGASADDAASPAREPISLSTLREGVQAQDATSGLTNLQAAQQLPHSDLSRSETLTLMSSVFGPVLQSAAGPFDDLHIEKFLSDESAIIAAGDQPDPSGVIVGKGAQESGYNGPTLIESTVPLRTSQSSGSAGVVDLGLERASDDLQSANPLVPLTIPQELGEGIELPESDIHIDLANAPDDRTPSIIEQSVAAYPNIAQDSSFVIAPTPTGFETMTLLQTSAAPVSQTFGVDLPDGAALEPTDSGGAKITQAGQAEVEIAAPSAIDAAGKEVPVTLAVSGSTMTVTASPGSSAAYPIMVDPKFTIKYEWHDKNEGVSSDWSSVSTNAGLMVGQKALCTAGCPENVKEHSGLDIFAKKTAVLKAGDEGTWNFYVPRYYEDQEKYGQPPQSFITSMVLSQLVFETKGKKNPYLPAMVAGIFDPIAWKYTSNIIHGGNAGNLTNLATTYTFGYGGDENAKRAVGAQLYTGEAQSLPEDEREMYVGTATMELGDSGVPTFGTPTPTFTGWVNNAPTAPLNFTASDAGLGVSSILVREVGAEKTKEFSTKEGCNGTPSNPCPRTWKSGEVGQPTVTYNPSVLPQGKDTMEIIASDAIGNVSTATKTTLRVDHTAPTVTLSGSMTEQATLGVTRPKYVLTVASKDGSEAAPQSGVVSTEITIDGKKVDSTNAGCATENCSTNRGWALESALYSVGKHVVVAKATDGVGLMTEKVLNIEIQKDTTKPTIENFGTLYNAPDGWVEQKNYEFGINAWDKGYGVTSLEFKMDGSVVKSVATPCPNGGCTEWLNVAINMANYKGGAHTAAILAKDGAGNVTTETWTVNVNPKGEVSAAEAISTLKAVDATSGTNVVTPTSELIEPGELEEGNAPGLKQTGTDLVSTGTGADTVMTTNPSGVVTIDSDEGNIKVDPLSSIKSTESEVTGGSSVAVAGGASVDTVVRPIYDGLMTYQEIRDGSAPQTYSWEVSLRAGQSLKAVDSQHVAIFNEDGTQALAIAAEPSHDATGKSVPTELSVSGKILTLTVKHVGGGFVYPIVGGPSFHAGYVEPVIYTPPPPTPAEEPETEEELINILNGQWPIIAKVSAPQMVGCPGEGEACASSSGYIKTYGFTECIELPLIGCANAYEQKIRGFFYFNFNEAWMSKRQPNCESHGSPTIVVEEEYCKWVGPDHQKYGNGYHITSQVKFRLVSQPKAVAGNWKYITVRMFGSGNAYAHQTSAICNPSRPGC